MRIALVCDHKWRDLPALVMIRRQLQHLGHRANIVATKVLESMIPVLKPDLVVLNHFFDQRYQFLAKELQSVGCAVAVLPTEGVVVPHREHLMAGKLTDFSLVDLHLCWNEEAADLIDRGDKVVVGCPRLCTSLGSLWMRKEQIQVRYSLDPGKPIVAFANSFAMAWADPVALQHKFNAIGIGLNAEDLVYEQIEARDKLVIAYRELQERLPQFQFVWKPHPADDMAVSATLIGRGFLGNCYIGDLANAADLLVNSNCTTSVDFWLQNKPVIDVDFVPSMINIPQLRHCNHTVLDLPQLQNLIEDFASEPGFRSELLEQRRAELIKRWFHVIDERRCLETSMAIHKFIANKQPARRLGFSQPAASAKAILHEFGMKSQNVDSRDKVVARRDIAVIGDKLDCPN